MPIVTLQRSMRELGRIRAGNQVESKSGRMVPNKLGTFRLTSSSPEVIAAAASIYGGEMLPWDNGGLLEYEVITEAASMPIVVPPGNVISQWNELWSGGGCIRRCDGEWNQVDGTACGSTPTVVGQRTIPPCSQDIPARVDAASKGLACKETTRLSVILPELPDLGVWRLETRGHNAAVHLAGAVDILVRATDRGMLIPARLRLVEDSKKIPGQPTKKWYEPVIEFVETTFAELGITGQSAAPRLAPGVPDLPRIAAPASSDFRAPALVGEIIEHSPAEPAAAAPLAAAGTCGWILEPKDGGPKLVCTFAEHHPPGHSWHDQRMSGRAVPPA